MYKSYFIPYKDGKPLPGLNEYTGACRTHPQAGASMKKKAEKYIKEAVYEVLSVGEEADGPYHITFLWREPSRRRDPDNIAFAKKFILDAFVDLGILKTDTWSSVEAFIDDFVVDKEKPGVLVTIFNTTKADIG